MYRSTSAFDFRSQQTFLTKTLVEFCLYFRGGSGRCAPKGRDPTSGRSCFATADNSECKTILTLKIHTCLPRSQRPADCADRAPARFFNMTTGQESSEDGFGIWEDDRCIDARVFQQRHLLHELVFACSEPPPQHGHRMGEARNVAGVADDHSEEQKGGHLGSTIRAQSSPFCCWTSAISRMRSQSRSIKNTKVELYSEVTL